jgi:hypothetical protein
MEWVGKTASHKHLTQAERLASAAVSAHALMHCVICSTGPSGAGEQKERWTRAPRRRYKSPTLQPRPTGTKQGHCVSSLPVAVRLAYVQT